MKILLFVISFSLIVLLHELGHYLCAKRYSVRVKEFGLGFGPKLFRKIIGDTEFSIKLIPLGGSIKMLGEMPWQEIPPEEKHLSFSEKTLAQKLNVLGAGPAVNILSAALLFFVINLAGGAHFTPTLPVGTVYDNSPADDAGMLQGDQIQKVNGEKISSWKDLKLFMDKASGDPLLFTVQREEETINLSITPEKSENRLKLGFTPQVKASSASSTSSPTVPATNTVQNPAITTMNQTVKATLFAFKGLGDSISQGSLSNLAGPIKMAEKSIEFYDNNFLLFLFFIAFISLNLGLFNLLPIPGLDGGLIAMLLIQKIIGKQINFQTYRVVISVGLGLVVAVMLAVLKNDLLYILT